MGTSTRPCTISPLVYHGDSQGRAQNLTVCYVGVSFFRSLDKQALLTSVAQVFNERGEKASSSAEDTQPSRKRIVKRHLPEAHAYELLKNALCKLLRDTPNFSSPHRHPARVRDFDGTRKTGFAAALAERGISTHDFLWLSDSNTKLYRAGQYPPLRGTLLTLDEREMVLYTRGSVPFFETYPGKYIPPSSASSRRTSTDQTPHYLAREILALTKMNWNNSQFDGAEPVTLRASRQCSSVLRYCSEARPSNLVTASICERDEASSRLSGLRNRLRYCGRGRGMRLLR